MGLSVSRCEIGSCDQRECQFNKKENSEVDKIAGMFVNQGREKREGRELHCHGTKHEEKIKNGPHEDPESKCIIIADHVVAV